MEFGAVARLGLLLVRPGALMLVGPGLGGRQVPVPVRIALTVMLALVLAPSVTIPSGAGAGLLAVVLREIAIGLALGLAARAVIAGAEMAGHICSQQIGFSYAATIDPEGGARNTVLASLYGLHVHVADDRRASHAGPGARRVVCRAADRRWQPGRVTPRLDP